MPPLKSTTANLVVSVDVTVRYVEERGLSLTTVTTAAEGLATVNPLIAFIAVYRLSAVVLLL